MPRLAVKVEKLRGGGPSEILPRAFLRRTASPGSATATGPRAARHRQSSR